MSKILKRPMFRKGGEVSQGVMKLAMGGRAKYQEGTPDPYDTEFLRQKALYEKALGPSGNTKQDLYDLLISGGLNLAGGVGAGDGTIASIARSFKEPTEKFLAKRPAEEAAKKQIGIYAAKGAIEAEAKKKELEAKARIASMSKSYESGTLAAITKGIRTALGGGAITKSDRQAAVDLAPKIARAETTPGINYQGIAPMDKSGKKIDPNWVATQGEGSVIVLNPYTRKFEMFYNGRKVLIDQNTLKPITK